MSLVKDLTSKIKFNHWWTSRTRVVVAVSTGIDSMVLLHLLEDLRYDRPRIIVAHVNHELRIESRTEERYLRKYCRVHHLPLVVAHWPKAQHPRTGVENAARIFRYRFFARIMKKRRASVLLTAHHLNDQAETILMRLIRGGDLNELTGIHQVRSFANGRLIRPLLRVPKSRIRSYARVHRIKYYRDRTNRSLKMTRNRMRHRLLPVMKKENSRVIEHLGDYAIQIRDLIDNDRQLNRRLMRSLHLRDRSWYRLRPLLNETLNCQQGILRELFKCDYPRLLITPPVLREIIQLLNDSAKPQGRIEITKDLDLVKSYHKFGVKSRWLEPSHSQFLKISFNRWYSIGNGYQCSLLTRRPQGTKISRFFLSSVDLPLIIRTGRPSDRIRLKGGGHQKVRRILIDQKVPNLDRRRAKVLVTHRGRVLALLGYKVSVTPRDNQQLQCFLAVRKNKRGSMDE